jgi:hypothetical protein
MEIQDLKSSETIEFIKKLSELSEFIRKAFSQRTPLFNGEKYLTNIDVCKFLHMSQRTLQDYRDNGKIGYIQISGKILYKESDIIKLLEDNYMPKRNNNYSF